MIDYCFCGISLDSIEKIGSLFVGVTTLIILIAGYYKFLENQLRNKQLDVVASLVGQIQQFDWHYLHFNNFEDLPKKHRIATLFDIAEMKEFDECDTLYFWGIDIEPIGEELLSWGFFHKFYSHPLLPTSIAIPLKKFTFWRQQDTISFDNAKEKKYIAIGRKKVRPEDAYFFYLKEGEMRSCKEFKKAAKELKDAIIIWSDKYGLDDLNITTSHIHQSENN